MGTLMHVVGWLMLGAFAALLVYGWNILRDLDRR